MKTIAKLLALAALLAAPLFAQPSGNTLPRNNPTFAGTLTGPLEVLNQPGIATTSTDALTLQNATASTSGATVQYSPRLHFVGHAWNLTATAADNYADLIEELRPISAATPTAFLAWASRISTNGTGAFTDILRVYTDGTILAGGLTTKGAGAFQLPTATTSAGGITLGNVNIFQEASNDLRILASAQTYFSGPLVSDGRIFTTVAGSAGTPALYFSNSGVGGLYSPSAGATGIVSSGILALTLDSSQNLQATGTINHGGQKVVATQYDSTGTTLATVTGLSATVVAGKTYTFRAVLHVTADAVGGLKYTVAGTATATSVIWQQVAINAATGAIVGSSRTTALGTTSNFITTTSDEITIDGSIVVNAGGTLLIQAAQQAANGTSSVLVGSSFIIFGG